MSFTILGLSTALPQYSIKQSQAAETAKHFSWDQTIQTRLLPALFRRAQVAARGSVVLEQSADGELYTTFYQPASSIEDRGPTTATRMERYRQEAIPLAAQAARQTISRAALAPREITHVITVSCTGFMSPGVDIALIKQLGLRPTVGRVHIGFMGCHGALNALRVAQALVEADRRAKVLVCAVELCSLHYQYGDAPEQIVANALFADGAAALVATAAVESPAPWQVAATGSVVFPDSEAEMGWQIGDYGFQMNLSPRVPDLIAQHLRPWLEQWLSLQSVRLDEVRSWAIHPGGPRILSSTAEALGLSAEATAVSSEVLAAHGNMSSPTVLFVLERLQKQHAPRPCVALAFGPGLVAEAALLV